MSYKDTLVKIKNFVFDVDGVFTDGSIIVDNQGNEFRVFRSRDGIAVLLASDQGYSFCVISGGKHEGVRNRLNWLGVKNVFLGVDDNIQVFDSFINDLNLNLTETIFMGDDLPDINFLFKVGFSCCPPAAAPAVRAIVVFVSFSTGGEGCVRDLIEQVLPLQNNWG
jgi:3-deoxy-D-manno-octulosonate 8-phosphate phosphatase, YrbI family